MDRHNHPIRQLYGAVAAQGRRPTSAQLDEVVEEVTVTDLGAGDLSRKQLRRRISDHVETLLKHHANGNPGAAQNDAREFAEDIIEKLPPLPGAEYDERDRESTRPASDAIRKMVDDIPRGWF